jgi:acid phosphatase
MTRTARSAALVAAAALALAGVSAAQAATPSYQATGKPSIAKPSIAKHAQQPAKKKHKPSIGGYKHLVVIYEENHSFDNLYGTWGRVGKGKVAGLKQARAGRTQVDQAGKPITCLLQNDANLITTHQTTIWLDGSVHPGLQTPRCSGTTSKGAAYDSHFASSKPFSIPAYIKPTDKTCAPPDKFAPNGVEKGDPQGLPGGCTRDIVHRFYQEQYQLDHGKQDRYSTGSDAVGLTQGHYNTKQLPVYEYLHRKKAPHYVIADHFFQSAFGGSFLNHQWLIAAQSPQWDTSQAPVPAGKNSVIDAAGFPNSGYPLYKPDPAVTYNDGPLTQSCGLPTTVAGFACGNYAVNTMQPSWAPSGGGSNVLPGINDVDPSKPYYEKNIGDEMSAKGISWSWYAGGWDDAVAGHPDPLFQYHHQPFNYFQNYAPGMPGRSHLKDETDFFSAAKGGKLPTVSFVKPIGEENEHPGYASTHNGENHLVKLIRSIRKGPDGKKTLIVVTYDEFGGQWDHVAPPGQGRHANKGVHDQMGPGTRIPALIIGGRFSHSGVDHSYLDTTSIIATIEHAYGLAPLSTRDARVGTLKNTLKIGQRGHR